MERTMNENSLANLRRPKEKREGYGYRYTIPQEKIDELFSYIADGVSLKKASQQANIAFTTAQKYFKCGDVKRGIKPLQMRLEVFQERISEQMDVLLAEQRMDRIENVRKLIKKAEGKLLTETKEGEEDPTQITIRDYERLIKLEAFLCGSVKTTESEHRYLTADEIEGKENGQG